MPENKSYSILTPSGAGFNDMIRHFGVVTVMNAKIYEVLEDQLDGTHKVDSILKAYEGETPLTTLKSLKIANVTMDGPDKSVTGGQYNNTLIKFGKNARLEMQDALGNADALEAFGCAVIEHFHLRAATENDHVTDHAVATAANEAVHVSEQFTGPKTIIGESFFIDQKSGAQVPVKIIFYQFLADSYFDLTQDAEGDATVFDLNGDLLTTNILVGDNGADADEGGVVHGVFYSIVPGSDIPAVE